MLLHTPTKAMGRRGPIRPFRPQLSLKQLAHSARRKRRLSSGSNREVQIAPPNHAGQMKIAEIRHVRDVGPDPALLGRCGHGFVNRPIARRHEDEPTSLHIVLDKSAMNQRNRALVRETKDRLDRRGRHDRDLRLFGQQSLDLSKSDRTRPDDQAALPAHIQRYRIHRRFVLLDFTRAIVLDGSHEFR